MSDTILRVESVSKKYSRSLRHSMLYGTIDIARNFFGLSHKPGILRKTEFWGVDDISFSVKRGESLALVGSNGSGKSTMLKMLNGIFMPDKGSISINGKVAALIEVGAGFHPLLTGRENIFVNGQILGMSISEIKNKFDEIVAFSEIESFLDTPVKNYSTGMYVRLGFSIAVHSPSDILLVDEVLAVGDLSFSIKCMKKMAEFRENGGSLVLVSHAMHNVKNQCDHAIWMEKGVFREFGDSVDVADKFEQYMLQAKDDHDGEIINIDPNIDIISFDYDNDIQQGESVTFEIKIVFKRRIIRPIFMIHMHSNTNESLLFSHYSNCEGYSWESLDGEFTLKIKTTSLNFKEGEYPISFYVSEKEVNNHLLWHQKMYILKIKKKSDIYGLVDVSPEFLVNN